MSEQNIYNPYVSVDCVVFGFDGEKLKVLLIERNISENNEMFNDKKLPGSMILESEDPDDAAYRILSELTGLKNIYLSQFRSFGNPSRTSNPRDLLWLQNTLHLQVGRIVTIAYVAMIKIKQKIQYTSDITQVKWLEVNELKGLNMAFDHKQIIEVGLKHIKRSVDLEPHLLFELLPRKFSLSQLRTLYDLIHQVKSDVRNFKKKVAQWPYVVPLEELEKNVPHRAARLYKFDKKKT